MERRSHASESYHAAGRISRMQDDLLRCSKYFLSSNQEKLHEERKAALDSENGGKLSVGVLGAGLSGLRCADVLISAGVNVTLLEARDRIGGRVHQEKLAGWEVDMGPSWVHGTDNNPIATLAKETSSQLISVEEDSTVVYDPQGLAITTEKSARGFDKLWDLINMAFKYSNEDCESIPPDLGLKDYFKSVLRKSEDIEDQDLILLLGDIWGGFIGDPWEKQSLRWFWLEECLDGENLFVSDGHGKMLQRVAEKALLHADVQLSTTVKSIESRILENGNSKIVVKAENKEFVFDKVVVTVPLGCLKQNHITFDPPISPAISSAVKDASISSLEKVFIAFPRAFWEQRVSVNLSEQTTTNGEESKPPSFVHFLQPTYTPEDQKSWTVELVSLSSTEIFGDQARPVLLFSLFGPCGSYLTSRLKSVSPASDEYLEIISTFFRPYFSLLPNYSESDADCQPSAAIATNWQNDDLAGNGSYTNFKVKNVTNAAQVTSYDKIISTVREGMPERGIFFAGEHTAPYVATGTLTGAYWSGEIAATKILLEKDLLRPKKDLTNC